MLPRWHIVLGAVFTAIIWYLVPDINLLYLALIFLSSFLIDFDHNLVAYHKTKKFSLKSHFEYYKMMDKKIREKKKKGLREKEYFFIFHTIEFNIIVALLGLVWEGFFYIFIGMVFHLLIDLADLLNRDLLYIKEFFFTKWAREKFKKITRN